MANFLVRAMLFFTGFTLPLSFVRVYSIGAFGITPNKITVAGLLVIAILLGVVERRPMPPNPKGWWVASFAASMLIGTTITLALGAPVDQIAMVASVLAAVVIFYYLLCYTTRSIKELDSLLIGLILGVALSSLSVLVGWGAVQVGRTGGLSGDPNNFAFVSAMTLPIVGYYFVTRESLVLKLVLSGFALVQLLAIASSMSRTGVVCLTAMGVMWMARFRRFDVLPWALPLGVLLAATIFFSSPEWVERMGSLTSRAGVAGDSSIQSRFVQYRLAAEAFASNPILGVGYKQFGSWAGARIAGTTSIHNSYLHIMAELGLLGIISYLGLIAMTYVEYSRAWRLCLSLRARRDPLLEKLYLLAVLLQISLVGAIVGNFFLNSMRYRISWLLYAYSAVVLVMVRRRVQELSFETAPVEGPAEFRPAHIMDTGPEKPVAV